MSQRMMLAFATMFGAAISLGVCSASAATSVTCTGGNQLSTAINAARATAKPGDSLEFLVTGNCVDSITGYPGLKLFLTGQGGGASLTASTASNPALSVVGGGYVSVDNMYLTASGSSTAGTVALAGTGGLIRVVNSSIVANGAGSALSASGGYLTVGNSSITGNKSSAIDIDLNSELWMYADNGKAMTVTYTGNSGGQAIGCWSSAMGGTTTGTGTLTIGPSTSQGISARACQATFGIGSMKGSVKITQAADAGIRAKAGDMFNLVNVAISNNTNIGVEVSGGVIEFDNSTISKPSAMAVGLSARRDGVIYFNNLYGASTVSWSGTNTNFYNCRQGGKIYGSTGNPSGGATTSGCLVTADTVTK